MVKFSVYRLVFVMNCDISLVSSYIFANSGVARTELIIGTTLKGKKLLAEGTHLFPLRVPTLIKEEFILCWMITLYCKYFPYAYA